MPNAGQKVTRAPALQRRPPSLSVALGAWWISFNQHLPAHPVARSKLAKKNSINHGYSGCHSKCGPKSHAHIRPPAPPSWLPSAALLAPQRRPPWLRGPYLVASSPKKQRHAALLPCDIATPSLRFPPVRPACPPRLPIPRQRRPSGCLSGAALCTSSPRYPRFGCSYQSTPYPQTKSLLTFPALPTAP
jgi:hypothetical protein